jgi:hypothetical protein
VRPRQGYIDQEPGEDASPLLEPGERVLRTFDLAERNE